MGKPAAVATWQPDIPATLRIFSELHSATVEDMLHDLHADDVPPLHSLDVLCFCTRLLIDCVDVPRAGVSLSAAVRLLPSAARDTVRAAAERVETLGPAAAGRLTGDAWVDWWSGPWRAVQKALRGVEADLPSHEGKTPAEVAELRARIGRALAERLPDARHRRLAELALNYLVPRQRLTARPPFPLAAKIVGNSVGAKRLGVTAEDLAHACLVELMERPDLRKLVMGADGHTLEWSAHQMQRVLEHLTGGLSGATPAQMPDGAEGAADYAGRAPASAAEEAQNAETMARREREERKALDELEAIRAEADTAAKRAALDYVLAALFGDPLSRATAATCHGVTPDVLRDWEQRWARPRIDAWRARRAR